MRALPILAAMLVIAGCHEQAPERRGLDRLDDQLTAHAPAVVADVPPRQPTRHASSAPTIQAADASRGAAAACTASLAYAKDWANRLPAGIALYPGATVSEAAGSDAAGCALRVVSFASAAPVAQLAGWYRGHAPGYTVVERVAGNRHTLTGDSAARAFILYLDPRRGGGTDADLIATGGR